MLIDTIEAFDTTLVELAGSCPLRVDLETEGLHPFAKVPDRIAGFAIGLADDPSTDRYISVRHKEGPNVPPEYAIPKLIELLRGRALWNHNLAFDMRALAAEGFALPPSIEDTMIAAFIVNEEEDSLGLKELGVRYLGANAADPEKELKAELKARKLRGKGQMHMLPASLVSAYAVQDIRLVRDLLPMYRELLKKWRLEEVYRLRCKYRLALTRVELRGVPVDFDELRRQQQMIEPMLEELRRELCELAGTDINPNSPKQLKEWLGVASTNKAALTDLVERNQDYRALRLLEYRSLQKANSSFFTPLQERTGADGRMRCNYKVSATVTHRLASSDINMQQIAKESSKRKYVAKRVFVPPPGWFVVESDLSQIEPRVAVHFSRDEEMIAAFKAGLDVHIRAAKRIFRVDTIDTETKEGQEKKDAAKALSLGTLYELGALKIAVKLKLRHEKLPDGTFEFDHRLVWRVDKSTGELHQVPCSVNDPEFCTCAGKGFQREYAETWPALTPFKKKVTRTAEENGYIRSPLSGAVRRFPDKRFCYKALNALIQQTSAYLLQYAILRMDEEFVGEDDPQLVATVHDSCVLFVKHGPRAYEQVKRIKEIMETTTPLIVPTPSSVKVGYTYGDLGSVQL